MQACLNYLQNKKKNLIEFSYLLKYKSHEILKANYKDTIILNIGVQRV